MDGRTVGLLVGAVGGTAFVVFNAPRLPTAVGVPLAVLAVAALVGLVVLVLRRRGGPGARASGNKGRGSMVTLLTTGPDGSWTRALARHESSTRTELQSADVEQRPRQQRVVLRRQVVDLDDGLDLLPILMRGGQVTFMAKWDAVAWIALAQRLRPTYGG